MPQSKRHVPDPKLDLVLERISEVPPELVFRGWTDPEMLKKWFTPKPWVTTDAEIDLRPGGIFRTVMRGPEGPEVSGTGCILEVVENEKLVWTGAMLPGFRPRSEAAIKAEGDPFVFTGIILVEPHPRGSKYTAIAIHADEEGAEKHRAMGFHEGWGAAFDQLVALAKEMKQDRSLEHA